MLAASVPVSSGSLPIVACALGQPFQSWRTLSAAAPSAVVRVQFPQPGMAAADAPRVEQPSSGPPHACQWTVEVSSRSGKQYFFHLASKRSSYEVPSELAQHPGVVAALRAAKAKWDQRQRQARHPPPAAQAAPKPAAAPAPAPVAGGGQHVTGAAIFAAEAAREEAERAVRSAMRHACAELMEGVCQRIKEGKAGQGSTFLHAECMSTLVRAKGGGAVFQWRNAAGAPTQQPPSQDMQAYLRGDWVLTQPAPPASIEQWPFNGHMWRGPPASDLVQFFITEVADDEGLIVEAAGEANDKHVIVFAAGHPPPELLARDREEAEHKVAVEADMKRKAEHASRKRARTAGVEDSAAFTPGIPLQSSATALGNTEKALSALRALKAKRTAALSAAEAASEASGGLA